MPVVTAGHVNRERRCYSAAFRPDFAVLGGQSAQQTGRIPVIPEAGSRCHRKRRRDRPGNADIPSGQNVQLRWVHVTGQVTVEGTLAAAADVFDHNVVVTGGNLSLFNQPSHIKGNLWVLGSPGDGSATSFFDNAPAGLSPDAATANGSVIGGDFTFAANSGRLYVGGPLTVGGNFVFALNTGPASDYSSSMTVNGHRFVS